MIRLYLASILFLFTFYVHAQQEIASLKDSLQHFSTDSLYALANTNRYKNPLQAKAYAFSYYKRVKTQKDDKKLYKASVLNAKIYNVIGEKDSAQYFIDESIKVALKANDEESYYNSLRIKGNIYFSYDDYENAILNYTKVYKFYEGKDDVVKLMKIRHNMALVENQIGRRKQALIKAKENIRLYNEGILDKEVRVTQYLNSLLNLSNIYTSIADDFKEEQKQYLDSAMIINRLGLKKSLEVNDLEVHVIFLTIQGIIHQQKGEFSKAYDDFNAAEAKILTLGLNNQLSLVYLHKGKNYYLQHNFDDAIEYLLKTDSIATKDNTSSLHLQETYILLAKSYQEKGELKKALKYHNINEEKDKENDLLMRKLSGELYKKYDVATFKKEINTLLEETEQEQQKSTTLVYACMLLIALSGVGFWYYKERERTFKKRFEAILKELATTEEEKKNDKEKNTQAYRIADENIQKILEGLERFEKKELFLQKKCTLNYVAKKVNTNSTYLSKTLQSHKQKKFVQYITDLRLNYALKRLKDDSKFRTYDIKSIASELGFNTAESFSKAFKKRTGIYPSVYIKNLNKLSV